MQARTENTVIPILLSLMLFWPVGVFAEDIKTVPGKIGEQIGSEARDDAIATVFKSLEELNCKDDPESQGCEFTKRNISTAVIGIGIISALGIGGAIYGIYKYFS